MTKKKVVWTVHENKNRGIFELRTANGGVISTVGTGTGQNARRTSVLFMVGLGVIKQRVYAINGTVEIGPEIEPLEV